MKDPITWFVILVAVCVAGPYVFHVRPVTARQRLFVALTIAFLAWILPLMVSVRLRVPPAAPCQHELVTKRGHQCRTRSRVASFCAASRS